MADCGLVDPKGWDCELQSVHGGYMGYFQSNNILWYEHPWGAFFDTFDAFLWAYEWPVITVTDVKTHAPHIVTQLSSVEAFAHMIRKKYKNNFPSLTFHNIMRITPAENAAQRMHTITSPSIYRQIHSTLPAFLIAAQKARARGGEPRIIQGLWDLKLKTFLAIDFEWSEQDPSTILEWGFAAVRTGVMDSYGQWPPQPEHNYRRGHYIVAENVDRTVNRHQPNFPWDYAFNDSQIVAQALLPRIIQATISSLASKQSETDLNTLVLVGHGVQEDLCRLKELGVDIPDNVVVIDTAAFERRLYAEERRGPMTTHSGKPRAPSNTITLARLLKSLDVDIGCKLHNAGNDAMLCLLALQLLLEPEGTQMPKYRRPGVDTVIPRKQSTSSTKRIITVHRTGLAMAMTQP